MFYLWLILKVLVRTLQNRATPIIPFVPQVPDFAEVLFPFSDKMSDFDGNGDGRISYEEFVSAVERTVRLADNEELLEPFIIADLDGKWLYFYV